MAGNEASLGRPLEPDCLPFRRRFLALDHGGVALRRQANKRDRV